MPSANKSLHLIPNSCKAAFGAGELGCYTALNRGISYCNINKYFPDNITPALISAINNLLKEVDVVEVDTDKILSTLFPKNQMVSLEEFRDHFKSLEHDIKQDRDESEIRIKLK